MKTEDILNVLMPEAVEELRKPNRTCVLFLKGTPMLAFVELSENGALIDYGVTTSLARALKFDSLMEADMCKEALEDVSGLRFVLDIVVTGD